jgi:FKBP-type peptidyl-prolyl cis-trans isomerase
MNQARDGDTVNVHYTGRLENAAVFGTSKSGQPIEVKIGTGRLIPVRSGVSRSRLRPEGTDQVARGKE